MAAPHPADPADPARPADPPRDPAATAPDDAPAPRRLPRSWWVVGLAIAAIVVIVLAPLASSDPDGLERVAQDNGFLAQAQSTVSSILPDYSVPGLSGNASTVVAGLIGVLVVFGLMLLLGRVLARRRP